MSVQRCRHCGHPARYGRGATFYTAGDELALLCDTRERDCLRAVESGRELLGARLGSSVEGYRMLRAMSRRKRMESVGAWTKGLGAWAFLLVVILVPALWGLWGFVDSVVLRAILGP